MKQFVLLSICGSVACAFPLVASAQSSVTLYGIVDAGITYSSNSGGSKMIAAQSGIIQGSRWGLRGSEDLSSDLATIFDIESGFDTFTGRLGQGGLAFGRQAYVGVQSKQYGMVTMGRQYDSVVDYIGPGTMNGVWGAMFSHASDVDNTNNAFRINNAVKYTSPDYHGLNFGGLYAFGGQAGEFSNKSTFSLGGSYQSGPLYVGVGYLNAKNPVQQFVDGNFDASNVIYGTNVVGPLTRSQHVVGGAVSYTIGSVKLSADYTNTHFFQTDGMSAGVKYDNYEVWGNYTPTAAINLALGYTFTDGKLDVSGDKPKYHQVNALADYRVSKRTDFYTMLVYQRAAGDAQFAQIYDGMTGTSTGKNQVAARIGMRHLF